MQKFNFEILEFVCSIQNWIEDMHWKQLDVSYPCMHDAMVSQYTSLMVCDYLLPLLLEIEV